MLSIKLEPTDPDKFENVVDAEKFPLHLTSTIDGFEAHVVFADDPLEFASVLEAVADAARRMIARKKEDAA